MAEAADIASGRLRPQDYAQNFDDLVPPQTRDRHPNNPMRQVAPE
jgi:hypothetical protein